MDEAMGVLQDGTIFFLFSAAEPKVEPTDSSRPVLIIANLQKLNSISRPAS
jgi:hypothetical protein